MSYNKFNGRYSRRYNTPGKFVPASEQSQSKWNLDNMGHVPNMPQMDNTQFNNPISKGQLKIEQQRSQQQPAMQLQQPLLPEPQQKLQQQPHDEPQKKPQQLPPPEQSEMDTKQETSDIDAPARPFWMKSKLQGVKKINNRERRRRQNETLRRLLAPKNALMVLNEMLPGDTLASQFKVEALAAGSPVRAPHAYCAQLALDTHTYTGYGETKIVARNAAAEQAIRDLMIQRMERVLQDRDRQDVPMDTESVKKQGSEEVEGEVAGAGEGEGAVEAEALPMIQLASFALHKLFAEWECGGHRVPQLKNNTPAAADGSPAGANAGPKVRALPEHAGSMHPCSLLTHMRPQLSYYELPSTGAPHGPVFSVAIDIDGHTYIGKASSKKEARRAAARAACEALYDVHFELP